MKLSLVQALQIYTYIPVSLLQANTIHGLLKRKIVLLLYKEKKAVTQNTTTVRHMKSYDEAFVTGCDEKHEWMLEWFFKNYKKYMEDVPLIFANFGYQFLR